MATLHLMVGLPCSGKTSLARRLERERSALRLTPDKWRLRLFGQDAEEPGHDARHALIEALLWEVAGRALMLGTNVILDFGLWAREEREDYRSRAKQLGSCISSTCRRTNCSGGWCEGTRSFRRRLSVSPKKPTPDKLEPRD